MSRARIPKKSAIVISLVALISLGVILLTNGSNILGLSVHGSNQSPDLNPSLSGGEEMKVGGKGTKFRIREKTMSDEDVAQFLKTTVIPEFKVDNVSLKDALKLLDEKIDEIRNQVSPRPKIIIIPRLYDNGEEQGLGGVQVTQYSYCRAIEVYL